MLKFIFTRMTLVSVVVLALLGALGWATNVRAKPEFRARPLASAAEAAQAALSYTQTYMHVLSGAPTVVYAQVVTGAELPTLGLPALSADQPLMLVIVQGDIDITGAWPGSGAGQTRYAYIDYVFDVQTGLPLLMQGELAGAVLKRAQNPAERLEAVTLPIPVGTPWPAGAVAPTVVPGEK